MITNTRAAWLAALMLATSLGGCATLQSARARIVKTPAKCVDQTVQIYFLPDAAEVTPEGRAVLRETAAQRRGCVVDRVEVTGLTDAAGDPAANLELSKRRADAVTALLTAAGLPAAEFVVAGAGEAGAASPRGEAQPMRRRADIVLKLSAPPRS